MLWIIPFDWEKKPNECYFFFFFGHSISPTKDRTRAPVLTTGLPGKSLNVALDMVDIGDGLQGV